jgi:predicted  nucleic acid-binding Zn-ribbon protein
MSSSNSPTKIQNPKSSNLLETAEVVFLAASALGLAASLVWGQSVYAQVPVVISLVLNFVNRQKLHKQVKASTAATFDRVNQQAVTTDRAIEQLQLAVNALDEALSQTSRENLNVGSGENVHSLISAIENLRQRLIILEKTIKMIQSEIELTSRQFKQRPELQQVETLTTIILDLQEFINELPQWGSLQQRQLTELQQKVDNALAQLSEEIAVIPNRVQEAVAHRGGEVNPQLGSGLNGAQKNAYRPKTQNEKIRQKYPRAYVKWSQDEDENLKKEYASCQQIGELAQRFQRQPGAIRSRLQKLGLIE